MEFINGDNRSSLRTFNASASHDPAGFRKSLTSTTKQWMFNGVASPSKRDLLDIEHAATIDSKLNELEQRMDSKTNNRDNQMRNHSEGLRYKNQVSSQKLGYVRYVEDHKMDERRRQFERIN